MTKSDKFLILDRDGTLIKHVHHLTDPDLVEFLDPALDYLPRFAKLGWRFMAVTNQSVIGRELATAARVNEINELVSKKLEEFGVLIEDFRVCPHLPENNCICRKPNPSLGLELVKKYQIELNRCFVIGDQESDMEFANNFGVRGFKICSHHKNPHGDFEGDWSRAFKAITRLIL